MAEHSHPELSSKISDVSGRVSRLDDRLDDVRSDMESGFSEVRHEIRTLETDIRTAMESLQGSIEQLGSALISSLEKLNGIIIDDGQATREQIEQEEAHTRERIEDSAAAGTLIEMVKEVGQSTGVRTGLGTDRTDIDKAITKARVDITEAIEEWKEERDKTIKGYEDAMRNLGGHIYPLLEKDWEQTIAPRRTEVLELYDEIVELTRDIATERHDSVEAIRDQVFHKAGELERRVEEAQDLLQQYPAEDGGVGKAVGLEAEGDEETLVIPLMLCTVANEDGPSKIGPWLLADGVLPNGSSAYPELSRLVEQNFEKVSQKGEARDIDRDKMRKGVELLRSRGTITDEVAERMLEVMQDLELKVKVSGGEAS